MFNFSHFQQGYFYQSSFRIGPFGADLDGVIEVSMEGIRVPFVQGRIGGNFCPADTDKLLLFPWDSPNYSQEALVSSYQNSGFAFPPSSPTVDWGHGLLPVFGMAWLW